MTIIQKALVRMFFFYSFYRYNIRRRGRRGGGERERWWSGWTSPPSSPSANLDVGSVHVSVPPCDVLRDMSTWGADILNEGGVESLASSAPNLRQISAQRLGRVLQLTKNELSLIFLLRKILLGLIFLYIMVNGVRESESAHWWGDTKTVVRYCCLVSWNRCSM